MYLHQYGIHTTKLTYCISLASFEPSLDVKRKARNKKKKKKRMNLRWTGIVIYHISLRMHCSCIDGRLAKPMPSTSTAV